MDELLHMLAHIYELLEQISSITTNQTTVLLESRQQTKDEEASLEIIENMMGYKDEIISEVNELEQKFEKAYASNKGKINDPEYVKLFKEKVQAILEMKKSITDGERNNINILNSVMSSGSKKIEIQKNAKEVAAAYKKQQIKS